jgi:hypothetical protein
MTVTYYSRDGGMTRAAVEWDEAEGGIMPVPSEALLSLIIQAGYVEVGPPPAAVFTVPPA